MLLARKQRIPLNGRRSANRYLAREPEADTVHILVWSYRPYLVERGLASHLGSNLSLRPLAKTVSPHMLHSQHMHIPA